MELTVITGMSGAGKSGAIGAFEDAGWFCIDNLPPRMLPGLADLFALEGAPVERVAVVCDLRGGAWFEELTRQLDRLEATDGVVARMIFLDASDEALLNRFRETRRRHPLGTSGSVLDAIGRERGLLAFVRDRADMVIDTSSMRTADLRREVAKQIADPSKRSKLQVTFSSFGFKNGALRDADLLFDVRFLPNPFYVEELASLTGLDEAVATYVDNAPGKAEFMEALERLLDLLLPAYEAEGRHHLMVGIGCTGGRHRSVAIAQSLSARYQERGYSTDATHRDISHTP